jgi:hypothetical protein
MDLTGSEQRQAESYSEQDIGSPVSVKGGEFLFKLIVSASPGLCSNLLSRLCTYTREMLRRKYAPFFL